MRRVNWLIVHHSASSRDRTTKEDVYAWHTDPKLMRDGTLRWMGKRYATDGHLPTSVQGLRGNGWIDIGYNVIIEGDGGLYPGRPLHIPGAHTRGHNKDSIGILVTGNNLILKDRWNIVQTRTLMKVVTVLEALHTAAKLKGHRDFENASTECPGLDIQKFLRDRHL